MHFDQSELDEYVLKTSKEKIHYHTIQFLVRGGKFGYKPLGSGVLVKINGRYLIFTASHVTENTGEQNLYISTPKGFLRVVGEARETDLEKDKHTDLAYIILEDVVGKALEEAYSFIPISMIKPFHQMEEQGRYIVIGYPVKNIRTEGKIVYAGSSTYLLQGSKDEAYEFHKLSKELHLVLNFAGKGIELTGNNKKKRDPEPYGISGCGLWLITAIPNNERVEFNYRLIGIMTQFRKVKYHVLVGNRVELLMEALIHLEGFPIRIKYPGRS